MGVFWSPWKRSSPTLFSPWGLRRSWFLLCIILILFSTWSWFVLVLDFNMILFLTLSWCTLHLILVLTCSWHCLDHCLFSVGQDSNMVLILSWSWRVLDLFFYFDMMLFGDLVLVLTCFKLGLYHCLSCLPNMALILSWTWSWRAFDLVLIETWPWHVFVLIFITIPLVS